MDNVTLNPGSLGPVIRTFADADGAEWQATVPAYATTLADGANVLQVVTPDHGLPVAQQGPWSVGVAGPVTVAQPTAADLQTTANQGGPWTVAATQSGTWSFAIDSVGTITNPVTIVQDTAADLLVTANQGGTWNIGGITNAVEVTQEVAANLLCTASIAPSQTLANLTTLGTITNAVSVVNATAGNLLMTANQGGSWTVAATQSGTWTASIASGQTLATVTNVGTVGTITNAVTVAQPTASSLNATAVIAAGTALIGKVSAGSDVSNLYDGSTQLTPKFAIVTASTSGNTQVVAAVAGKHIRVLRWSVNASGTVDAALRSGTTTPITGTKVLISSASAGGAYCPVGICQTAVGEALNINLSAAIAVSGELTYVEVG